MGSGAQPATARAAHAAGLARRGQALLLKPRGAEGSAAGDLAFTHGEAALPTPGEPVRGAYMRIWQRRGDGWRLVLAQLLDPPPPPRRPS